MWVLTNQRHTRNQSLLCVGGVQLADTSRHQVGHGKDLEGHAHDDAGTQCEHTHIVAAITCRE